MKKKIITPVTALFVVLCAALVLQSCSAKKEWTQDSLRFSLEGGTLTVSGEGELTSLYALNKGDPEDEPPVETLVLGPGVTGFGNGALADCGKLRAITAAEDNPYLTSVDGVLFRRDMTALLRYPPAKSGASYSVPESVTEIGSDGFSGCRELREVSLPEGLSVIGDNAFNGCERLSQAALPESLTDLGRSAFAGCHGLTEVRIPAGLTRIGDGAFQNCAGVTAFTVEEGNLSYYTADGVLFRWEENVLVQFPNGSGLTEYAVPERVTKIGDGAFYNNAALTEVTFPDNLKSIGKFAFSGCAALRAVTLPDSVYSVDAFSFAHCASLSEVHLGRFCGIVGVQAFFNCPKLLTLEVPENVEAIGSGAFGYKALFGKNRFVDGFRILCAEGSAAQSYAEKHGIRYELAEE
ncbi:MAG: leucine-rich repeat domain-containing protein [Clostridia bacterium]|nr:leucine-rich repeat domain-containing protein [Clostridia bacterium]